MCGDLFLLWEAWGHAFNSHMKYKEAQMVGLFLQSGELSLFCSQAILHCNAQLHSLTRQSNARSDEKPSTGNNWHSAARHGHKHKHQHGHRQKQTHRAQRVRHTTRIAALGQA